ncbi:SoxS protein [Paracoccus sp. PARArs4]|uniref:SoxS protein n=1 Tax=Paracoccus sp. PARArs4 TaxID=2853442 RepID=UPI0024A6A560|nr:SoxS protein [Paracoccus sp. PARArs4]
MQSPSRRAVIAGLALGFLPLAARAATDLRLMVITADDCHESAAFRREVMHAPGASAAARMAPMFEQPLDAPWPDGLAIGRMPRVTPSFLLLANGIEIDRFEGYSDPASFDARLRHVLDRAVAGG